MKKFNPESIKKLRDHLGLTQHEFAKRLAGTYQAQHVSAWETGVSTPSLHSLTCIVNAFSLPFDIFFIDVDYPKSTIKRSNAFNTKKHPNKEGCNV